MPINRRLTTDKDRIENFYNKRIKFDVKIKEDATEFLDRIERYGCIGLSESFELMHHYLCHFPNLYLPNSASPKIELEFYYKCLKRLRLENELDPTITKEYVEEVEEKDVNGQLKNTEYIKNYYQKNKERINKLRMERYYRNKKKKD